VNVLPKSLVGRNALFVTLILILNEFLWFGVVRPLVFNRYVQADQIHHPQGLLRIYLELAWAAFALLICTVGVYVIFFWLRRQLQNLVHAARDLGSGRTPAPLPETGPEEIRELSRGFNQLALNLEALDADRRLMLAGISHDLSTPLTRLRLAAELMQIKTDPAEAAGMIQDIEDMNDILVQFADYAKSGREEQAAVADFNHVVAEVCQRHITAGKLIRFDAGQLPLFSFRVLALRRLVTNLVDNALRYGTGDVELRTHFADGQVVLTVLDRGPGIRSTDPNSLVKPFAREDAARGTPLGAGLGLAIVERIAKAHGGTLSLSNRSGGGLAVTVTLATLEASGDYAGVAADAHQGAPAAVPPP
jgi:two-component system osmolarity sensor histidine kinase EnvZ